MASPRSESSSSSLTSSTDYESSQKCVETLIRQCQRYIVMHLEEYAVSYLSLLPLTTRDALLRQLPLADVCQLEGTKFMEGLDMTAYWKGDPPYDNEELEDYIRQNFGLFFTACREVEKYTQEWDKTEFERAVVYGQVVAAATRESYCKLSFGHDMPFDGILKLLFAVRKLDRNNCKLELVMPPRYLHKLSTSHETLIDEAVSCFGGELPTVIILSHDHIVALEVYKDPAYVHYFSKAVIVTLHDVTFEKDSLESIKVLVESASNLEVLTLEGKCLDEYDEDMEAHHLDPLFTFLSSSPKFWSNIRLFKILPAGFVEYFISREVLEELITVYFSSPTSHMQHVALACTKIMCYDVFYNKRPKIDQRFLHFKTVELDNCTFVAKSKGTPTTISKWLQQPLSELGDEAGTCWFKLLGVDDSGCHSRKRKYSEVQCSDDSDNREE